MRRLGLANRLTLTLVLVVVALQAVSVLGLMRFQRGDQDEWRLPVPVLIAAAAAALDRTPSQARDDLLVALNGDATRFFIADGVPAGYRAHGGPLPALLRSYDAALGARDVRLLVPEERRRFRPQVQRRQTAVYAVSVALADGQRLVVAPGLGQRRRSMAMAALVFSLLVGLTAAFLVWRMVHRATRDLQAIADASDRFARDLGAPPMDETGHAEARRVASAFNRMRARIKALVSERMRMLAAAAHDLKTLMTRLRLRVALIEDPDQRARADRDVALMATLIEDVLLVARGESDMREMGPIRNRGVITAIRAFLDDPLEDWSIDRLAKHAGMSRTKFAEDFRRIVGRTPMQTLARLRLTLVTRKMLLDDLSVEEAADMAGYSSSAAFIRAFSREFGATPLQWRKMQMPRMAEPETRG